MNLLEWIPSDITLLSPAVMRTAAWTLIHFLWQGALVGGVLAMILPLLRRRSASLRYVVALVALATMILLPVVTATVIATQASSSLEAGTTRHAASVPMPAAPAQQANTASGPTQQSVAAVTSRSYLEPAMPWLVVAWLAGVTLLSLAHFGGLTRVRQLRQQDVRQIDERWQTVCQKLATRLAIRRPVRLLESARVGVPTVIGWLRPVILVPASALTGLSQQQLESILAHELAHVRRHDVLVNTLQVAVETLLFYHPAVWWVSRQVRTLREHCCDDLAVEVCGDRMTYARALAELEDLRFAAPVFALGADGGPLLQRIRRLVGSSEELRTPTWLTGTLAATALATTLMTFAFAGQSGIAQEARDKPQLGSPQTAPAMLLAQLPGATRPDRVAQNAPQDTRQSSPTTSTATAPATAPIPIDQLIEMKIHRVDELLADLEGTPHADLPIDQLIKMAMFGIDGRFIDELETAGLATQSAAELVELAKFGIDGEFIEELTAAGLANQTTDQLIELAKFGIDGEFIETFNAAGLARQTTDQLIELAKFGVDGELIEELGKLGFGDIATEQLTDLAKYGVDGDFIRELREAGINNLSFDDLVRLARHNLDAEFITKMRRHRSVNP